MAQETDYSVLLKKTEDLISEKGSAYKIFAVYRVDSKDRIYTDFFLSMAELSKSGLLPEGYCAEMMTAEELRIRIIRQSGQPESSENLADQVKNAVLKEKADTCPYPDGYVFIDFAHGVCGLVNKGKSGTERCNVPKGMIEEYVPDDALAPYRHCTACGFNLRDSKFLICADLPDHGDKELPPIGEFRVISVYDAPLANETEILASIGLGMGPMDMLSDFLGEVFRKLTSDEQEESSETETGAGDEASEDDPENEYIDDWSDTDYPDPEEPPTDEELEDILPVNTAMALATAAINHLWYVHSQLIDNYDDDIDELTDCLYALHCRANNIREELPVSDEEAEDVLTDVLQELGEIAEENGDFSNDAAALLQLVQVYTGFPAEGEGKNRWQK